MHRFIMNLKPGDKQQIDHKNRNGLDNRKENLRLTTDSLNNMNKGIQKNNTSGYRGVSLHKKYKKWRSTIQINKRVIHIGYFCNIEEAVLAYNKKALELYGEYAYLNKIREIPLLSRFDMRRKIN